MVIVIEPAPVEDIGQLAALTKAAPLAVGESEVLSVALVAIAPVPLFIAAAGRSPEELGRSCLVRTGEVVSARRALLLSWPGSAPGSAPGQGGRSREWISSYLSWKTC